MFVRLIVVLIVVISSVVSDDQQQVRKCCPQGESLYRYNDTLECHESAHTWTYADIVYGMPEECLMLEEYADSGNNASCIDNLDGKDRIVAVSCLNMTNDFVIPSVNYLTKCCPMERVYDSVMQTCWGYQRESWPTAFMNVLMYDSGGVIDVRHGVPDCPPDKVVVDRLVVAEDVRRHQSASVSFKYRGREYIMNPDEVCLDRTELRDVLVVRVCEDERTACEENTCLRKCCPEEQSFYESRDCSVTRRSVRPIPVYNVTSAGALRTEFKPLAYWYGMDCEKYIESPSNEYVLSINGSISYDLEGSWSLKGKFCVENVEVGDISMDYVFFCFPPVEVEEHEVNVWTTFGMLVSSVFLLLTIVVYSALPSLKNLHGKTLMCHVACLLSAYLSLSTVQLVTDQLLDKVCVFLGYTTLFSFLSAFFWLNVISFDIWWTFGSMRHISNRRRRELRRFLAYSLYAWLTAAVITALAILADNLDVFPMDLKPGIGIISCWFNSRTNGVFVFFIGPVGVLLTINLFFFIMTARHCSKVKNDLDKVGHTPIADKKFKSDKTRFIMNGKLFIVMGINWGLEMLSEVYVHMIGPSDFWYISDMANACQGLIIFAIFVLKRRILLELKVRTENVLCCRRPPPRMPSVSTLYSVNNASACPNGPPHLKKSVSESRLSPLPVVKHKPNLNKQLKSRSANRLQI